MKVISTTLKLACCPLAFRDIAWAKSDVDFRKNLAKACIYMVAKKPHLDFCNVRFAGSKIDFDLVNVNGRVSLSVLANEPIFKPSNKKTLVLDLGSDKKRVFANNKIEAKALGMRFYEVDEAFYKKASDKELTKCLDEDSFVTWLTPEKLLYMYSKKRLRIPNFDKTKSFLWNYEPMYIGKVPKPLPLKRHRHHETFLDLLESEIEDCEDIRDDAVLLFFEVEERDNSLLIGNAASVNEFQIPLNGKNFPSMELLSVAAERVFAEKFKPKYNAVLFHPCLEGAGDLNACEFDVVDYAIDDCVTFTFKDFEWRGGAAGNCLVYSRGASLNVMRPMDFDDFLERKFIEFVLEY